VFQTLTNSRKNKNSSFIFKIKPEKENEREEIVKSGEGIGVLTGDF